ncbi:MAG: NAD(P)H-dependent oxidoreductase [Kofleriaceae bacterium]
MKVLGLCGSLRRASLNRALLGVLAQEMPEGTSLTIHDGLADLPLFSSDLAEPASATALKAAIADHDAVVFATPEYNYSIPGALKNAIDWASRPPPQSPLRGKPVGIIGAATGMSGTMRAQLHLRQILVYTDSPAMAQPEVLIPRAHERFTDGVLTDDSVRALLRTFAGALAAHVARYPARA